MAKSQSNTQTVSIDEGTTIVIDEKEYSGTVEVSAEIAEKLKETGRVKDVKSING